MLVVIIVVAFAFAFTFTVTGTVGSHSGKLDNMGAPTALFATVNSPARDPATVGLNLTLISQDLPAGSDAPQSVSC